MEKSMVLENVRMLTSHITTVNSNGIRFGLEQEQYNILMVPSTKSILALDNNSLVANLNLPMKTERLAA